MRAANILQKTDTLPSNILCLTFTESGSQAMRNRLTDIIECISIVFHFKVQSYTENVIYPKK
jgi:ATP-dependent exoDNAse (exonuclease V) beta subunit